MNSTPGKPSILGLVAVAAGLTVPAQATAQIPDARVVPRGALRITFSPVYTNYDSRFSLGTPGLPDGSEEPLGTDLTVDPLGSNVFPSLLGPTDAVRTITGDTEFEFNLGSMFTDLDADIRVFPFDLALGISNRLTFNARLPIVTTRMNAFVDLDSATSEAGLNLVATDAAAAEQAETLLADLTAAIAFVEGAIASGGYGCPGSAACTAAQETIARAAALATALGTLTGLAATDGILPPATPLASSTAGVAILGEITNVSGELAALGAPAVGGSLPLPDTRLTADDLGLILAGDDYGYSLFPLQTTKLSRFGDMELGLRYQVANRPSFRAVVLSGVRLPTGQLDSPRSVLDIGTGDRQTDLTAGFELAYAAGGRLGFSAAASYTYQMEHSRPMRVTRTDHPIAPAAAEQIVNRNPGDILQASFHPWLQLGEGIQAFATVAYYNKGSDTFSAATPLTTSAGFTAADLGFETANRSVSFGGGIAYRSTRDGRGRNRLPIEAGLNYTSAFSGAGGMTPKFNRLNLYLRLYYRIFGAPVDPGPGNGN